MLRVVLGTLLAVAVVGASVPAVDSARIEATDSRLRGELTSVRAAIADLLVRDDPTRGPGARRVLTVRLPRRSWGQAGTARVALGVAGPGGDVLAWQARGGGRRTLRLPARLRAPGEADALVLRRPGRHRLVLALVPDDGEPVVTVRRHTFKSENGTSPAHARIAR